MRPLFFGFFLLSFCSATHGVLACDCDDISVEDAVKKSKLIVIAQVVELLDTKQEKASAIGHLRSYQSYRVKVKVKQALKGSLESNKIIEIRSDYSDCNLIYDKDKEYLLFLDSKDTIYEEQVCSHSRLAKGSESLIKDVKKAVKDSL